jgi:hypothetical protein
MVFGFHFLEEMVKHLNMGKTPPEPFMRFSTTF